MKNNTACIEETGISRAWGKAFLKASETTGGKLIPLTVVININSDEPDLRLTPYLNASLTEHQEAEVETVANTIFPFSLWNPNQSASNLFERYERIMPRLHNPKLYRQNQHGLYFERLIDYHGVNQLDHVISTYQRQNRRRSALQAAIFDPEKDHTHQRQRGFPCMQQVAFVPLDQGELAITGFYATQCLFEKAYGNYLGLYRLGCFMGKYMGLRCTRVCCIASTAKYSDGISKISLTSLEESVRNFLANSA